ncbi:unnamed protein product [Protopolystoma xenopodis]|uniref:GBF1-like tetratricopeptide repeats domain-containing protein n=1 Tax=Protopolystoma xenopodis TaxID=117903 RepID=A0A3S5A4E6_9PLAT|nr:unnamed protein product [Protopolystoma xenopodis]
MARLCSDARREVRCDALAYLQRSLLSPILHCLSGSHWADCFSSVLFPLLTTFLETIAYDEAFKAAMASRLAGAISGHASDNLAYSGPAAEHRSPSPPNHLPKQSGNSTVHSAVSWWGSASGSSIPTTASATFALTGLYANPSGRLNFLPGSSIPSSDSLQYPSRTANPAATAAAAAAAAACSVVDVSDPRMRAIPLLTKVFLQHLNPLHQLIEFPQLWTRVLAYMECFMLVSSSDSLV